MDRPVIFLSAVSAEFRELRQLLHDSFKTHFHVITQYDTLHQFPGGDVRQLLSDAIDGSHAVLHLAGAGFGSTAAAPFPEMPGFLCSWTQYEYYYAHSFDADPVHRKQIFAIVCGPTLRSPTFTEKDDATLTAAQKAPLQEAHCQRIFSGKFDASPLASLPRTVNHGQPINDNAAALRAAIDICAQLATRQPAFQSACALVQVSLQDQLKPLLDAQLRIEKKQKRLLLFSLCTLAALALIGGGIFLLRQGQKKQDIVQKETATQQSQASAQLATQLSQVSEALSRLQQQTDPKTDPLSGWSQERLETALAQQLQLKIENLRAILTAGRTSLDALVSAQALLASGKAEEAGKKFDEVITQDQAQAQAVNQRLMQAYAGKAQIAFDQADYKTALSYRQQAAALVDKEKDPIPWAEAQGEVTFIQLYLAQYHKAEPLMLEILRLREQHLGPTHASTATALNHLSSLLKATNRLAEAEPLVRRAIQIDEAAYGKDHPDVAIRLSNLAGLLKATNRLAEAELLSRQTVGILLSFQARTGHRNPNVLVILGNYLSDARALKQQYSEIHTRLAAVSEKAGLEPAAFEALWAEVLAKNYAGPYLVTVDEAVPGGQGIALGIKPGDVILRYHGQAITTMDQLIQLTGEVKDEAIPLEIQRGKEILKLTAKPGKLGVKIQNVMPPAPAE